MIISFLCFMFLFINCNDQKSCFMNSKNDIKSLSKKMFKQTLFKEPSQEDIDNLFKNGKETLEALQKSGLPIKSYKKGFLS
ncbi:MAG: hypothetical protein GY830_10605 [Bacteroidetes bacterium]|nr:hypothetical protein [Bacteroidota bacterium]